MFQKRLRGLRDPLGGRPRALRGAVRAAGVGTAREQTGRAPLTSVHQGCRLSASAPASVRGRCATPLPFIVAVASVLRMTAATDRARVPCGPAGRLARDRLAESATSARRCVVADKRRQRPYPDRSGRSEGFSGRGIERGMRLQNAGASCSHWRVPRRPARRRAPCV